MILWTLVFQTATADVKPPATRWTVPVHHELIIQGLEAHPEHVLLITPQEANGTISTSRVLSHETPQMIIAEGDAHSQQIWKPAARWMSREEYNQWRHEVALIIADQREACDERGEGCAHISRFEPSYAPPTSGIPCTLKMPVLERELQHKNATWTQRVPEPKLQQHVFSVTEISANACVLSPASAQRLDHRSSDPENKWSALAPATGLSSLFIGVLLLNRRGTERDSEPRTE